MSKIQKIGFVFILLIAFAFKSNSQILAITDLNLNPGGVIYDVAEDPYHDCYVVVGNFNMIDGYAVSNIAFINKSDLTVNTTALLNNIEAINGEIRSVEVYFHENASYWYTRLYLGGNFTTAKTYGNAPVLRNGFVELLSQKSKFLPPTETPFSITSWNIQIENAGFELGVNEILLQGDTLILAGGFFFSNGALPYVGLSNIICFNAQTHAWNSTMFNTTDLENQGYNFYLGHVLSIIHVDNYYYVSGSEQYSSGAGNGFIVRCNANGVFDPAYSAPLYSTGDAVWNTVAVESGSDEFLISVSKYAGSSGTSAHNLATGALIDNPISPTVMDVIVDGHGVANYKNLIFTRNVGSFQVSEFNGTYPAPVTTTIVTNTPSYNTNTGGLATNFGDGGLGYKRTHVVENYLFVSGNLLTTVNGTSRVGLAVYCLEPSDAKTFTVSDSTICPEQTMTYTISPVDFADGYLWEYTGNGSDFQVNGSVESFVEIASPTIQLSYTAAFTPGQLKVTPYAICNSTQKIYSNTITTNIVSNPLPHVNAGVDTVLTCYNDTIVLSGFSDSAVVSYEWLDLVPPFVQGTDTMVSEPGNYIFKVVNALGCPNFDTVNVAMDTIKPIPIVPSPPYEINCAIPVKDFLGSTLTPNTILEWYQDTVFFPNPITVGLEGGYYLLATDTINGCSKAEGIYVELDTDQPNVTILGYPNFNVAAPIDTLSCDQNLLNLICSSDTANTTTTWTDADTLTFLGDNITITDAGNYFIHVTNNDNGCTNFVGINIVEYLNIPGIGISGDTVLNCSVDSLSLFGSSLSSGATFEWSGIFVPISTNPLPVYDAGTYYFTVTNPDNGCTTTDSVVIVETNEINVSAGNDLLVCDQSMINLTATYSGTISGINYLWNTGSTAANEIYTAGNSAYAIVEIFGDNSCHGVDTVYLNLPPVPVINFQGFKPCDDGPTGQIVATPVSGIEPFQYSIDNGSTYQTSPVFGSLYVGTYPIWVKDSVNCDYPFQASIDANSSLPEPQFLFSTYNYESDTVTLIDVSNPPADSTIWEFPSELIVLDYNELSPTILLPDTGVFQITMKAYFGTCLVEVTKPIYAALFDSTNANYYNQNGIKSIELYPNPTSGNFTVTVEFYKSQRSAMVVQDMIGNTYVYNEYDETLTISQDIFLDLSVLDGTYVLKLISEFDSAYITFILAR